MFFSTSVFSLVLAAAAAAANPLVPPKPPANKRDGTFVDDLSRCPKLTSRGTPTNVHDLRVVLPPLWQSRMSDLLQAT